MPTSNRLDTPRRVPRNEAAIKAREYNNDRTRPNVETIETYNTEITQKLEDSHIMAIITTILNANTTAMGARACNAELSYLKIQRPNK